MKKTVIIVLLAMFAPPVGASTETDQALEQVRVLGKRWDDEVNAKTREIYTPLLKASKRDGVTVTRDITYGSDPRHRLDVVEPITKPLRPMPVVIYVHGGGLTRGDKDSPPGTPLAGLSATNVPTYFAKNGMLGVAATYRLVPNAKFPDGPDDVAAMVRWTRTNAQKYGGDPEAIFVIGHSAGGRIVGSYLYRAASQLPTGPEIAGAVLLSAAVGLETGAGEKVFRAYYGEDQTKWLENTPLGLFDTYKGRKVPTLITVSEYDPTFIEAPAAELIAKICATDQACPQFVNVRAHNHISTAMSLNTGDDSYGSIVLDFIRRTLAQRK